MIPDTARRKHSPDCALPGCALPGCALPGVAVRHSRIVAGSLLLFGSFRILGADVGLPWHLSGNFPHPSPCARRVASSSRSPSGRYRPVSGFADRPYIAGGMPPAFRNHLVPTACGTPAPTAASSLNRPAAVADQNRRCSSRPATGGRPGEDSGNRPHRSERRFCMLITTPSLKVLRRPIESTSAPAPWSLQQSPNLGINPGIRTRKRTNSLPDGEMDGVTVADAAWAGQVANRREKPPSEGATR